MSRRVVIYYLESEFQEIAYNLRKAFMQSVAVRCPNYLLSNGNQKISIRDAALQLQRSPEDFSQCDVLSFGHLASLLKYSSESLAESKFRDKFVCKYKFDYDVVVILSHASIFTIGSFLTADMFYVHW